MSIIDNLFRGRRDRSAQIAKERLLTVLVHDRVKLTPEMMEQLKGELSAVIARYVPQVEPGEIEMSLERVETNDHLRADVPLQRASGRATQVPAHKESAKGSIIDSLFSSRRNRSAQIAKERLLTVLVHDRVKLTPEMMEQLKSELSAVIARYVPQVEPGEIEVSLERAESSDHLKADIPLRRARS